MQKSSMCPLNKEVSIIAARMWSEMDAKKREPYILEHQKRSQEQKREPHEHLLDDLKNGKILNISERKRVDEIFRKLYGIPKMPVRPRTSFQYYLKDKFPEIRKTMPDKTASEYNKILGENWEKMSTRKRLKYVKLSKKDLDRYQNEMAIVRYRTHLPSISGK